MRERGTNPIYWSDQKLISGRGVTILTSRHWIKVFFLSVVKGTEAALPADVSHSFTNASNRNFERCRVDSNMWHRIMTHGTRNKCWSRLQGKLKNWRWKEICLYELIKIIPVVLITFKQWSYQTEISYLQRLNVAFLNF